jgi:hypothetical protein
MRLFQDYMGLSVFSTKEFGEMGQRQEFRSNPRGRAREVLRRN